MKHIFTLLFALQFFAFLLPVAVSFKIEPRIINGDTARKDQFPWQAALYINKFGGNTWCGGALISSRWILTAGHCVQGAKSFTIALGSNTLAGKDVNRVVLETVQYIQHEEFNSLTLANDVAVILLPHSVSFNEHIQPINLSSDHIGINNNVVVSGWGLTSDSNDEPSLNLNYVSLKTISDNECKIYYGSLPAGAFCAGSIQGLIQSTCEGDSGGPVVFYSNGGASLVGIVSFGHTDGCESGKPVAFVRINTYRKWIKNKTGI